MKIIFLKFNHNENGAVAIEFAIISAPLILLVVFFIEFTSHLFFNSLLDHSLENVARLMRTNQINRQTFTQTEFLDELFDPIYMRVFNRADIHIDVRTIDRFRDLGLPITANGNVDTSQLQFNPGGVETINVIRAFYEFPTFIAYQNFTNEDIWPNGKRLMASSIAFQVEP